MTTYKIAVVPGDDSGPEAMDAALSVLEKAAKKNGVKFELVTTLAGFQEFEKTGDTFQYAGVTYAGISEAAVNKMKDTQAMLYTACANAKIPRKYRPPWGLFGKYFNADINVRPGKSYPNAGSLHPDIDMVIVRDQKEGLMRSKEFMIGDEIACALITCTKSVVRRIAKVAFEMARYRNKPNKKVSVINKVQSSRLYFGMFLDTAFEVGKEYPDVECEDMHTDYLPYAMVKEPETLDVILCTNLLGDLYSDTMSGVIGSIGIGPGALYGDEYAIFKPSHGTAPDIAGQNIINPTATILSAKMMLEWLAQKQNDDGCKKTAEDIGKAIDTVYANGKVMTKDLGGNASTTQFTQEVLAKL